MPLPYTKRLPTPVYGRGGACPIDSNKVDIMPQLRSLLGGGPRPRIALAMGRAGLLTRLQGLWRCRTDPGGIDKGHLRPEAWTGTNDADLAAHASQIRQRCDAALQDLRHQFH